MMAFFAVAFMSVSLSSCSDDDDDAPKIDDAIKPDPTNPAITGNHDPELVGMWVWEDQDDVENWYVNIVYVFYSDGRYEMAVGQRDDDGDEMDWDTGYWATNKGRLYFYVTNSSIKSRIGFSDSGEYDIDFEGDLYYEFKYFQRL